MVLPSRRSSSNSHVTMSEEHVENKRPASSENPYPSTPYPQKRMRLAEREDTTPPTDTSADSNAAVAADGYDESLLVSEMDSPPREYDEEQQGDVVEEDDDDDVDWDKLAQSEPARTDVPVFLAAHARKHEANERFAAVLDECHSALLASVEALLTTVADVHNMQRDRLEAMEADIKHNLVCNDQARAQMQERLQESAIAAQGLFAKLLQRVTEPITNATARMQEAMTPRESK